MSSILSKLINLGGNLIGTLGVGNGGTGLTAGTSGGIPYYSSTSAMTSSALLTAHGVVLGGGAATTPVATTAGTAGQLFRSGGSSANGAYAFPYTTVGKSADYAITDTDGFSVILVTTGSSSDPTITLPQAANNANRSITIKKVDSGTRRVLISKHASDGSTVIDALYATTSIGTQGGATAQNSFITFISDGTNWWVTCVSDMVFATAALTATGMSNATWLNAGNGGAAITIDNGSWLITGVLEINAGGAVPTNCNAAVSMNSGVTTTDQVAQDNQFGFPIPTAATDSGVTIADWKQINTGGLVSAYLKVRVAYTGSTPQSGGRITAKRFR